MKVLKYIFSLLLLVLVAVPSFAQKSFSVNVWDKKAPEKNGLQDTAYIKVFLPEERRATGRAIVICPGGGYEHLAMQHEGTDWAPFFNKMGIATIVLHYRMPIGSIAAHNAHSLLGIANRHINEQNIGIMGFSAGGHLASTIATQSKGDAKPNFQILFYPVITMMQGYTHQGSHDNLLGKNASKKEEQKYCSDLQVSRVTPRACIFLSDDDHTVLPINGVNYYIELYRHDVPAALHVYPDGGHGYGMRTSFQYHLEMLMDLRAWLESF